MVRSPLAPLELDLVSVRFYPLRLPSAPHAVHPQRLPPRRTSPPLMFDWQCSARFPLRISFVVWPFFSDCSLRVAEAFPSYEIRQLEPSFSRHANGLWPDPGRALHHFSRMLLARFFSAVLARVSSCFPLFSSAAGMVTFQLFPPSRSYSRVPLDISIPPAKRNTPAHYKVFSAALLAQLEKV